MVIVKAVFELLGPVIGIEMERDTTMKTTTTCRRRADVEVRPLVRRISRSILRRLSRARRGCCSSRIRKFVRFRRLRRVCSPKSVGRLDSLGEDAVSKVGRKG